MEHELNQRVKITYLDNTVEYGKTYAYGMFAIAFFFYPDSNPECCCIIHPSQFKRCEITEIEEDKETKDRR